MGSPLPGHPTPTLAPPVFSSQQPGGRWRGLRAARAPQGRLTSRLVKAVVLTRGQGLVGGPATPLSQSLPTRPVAHSSPRQPLHSAVPGKLTLLLPPGLCSCWSLIPHYPQSRVRTPAAFQVRFRDLLMGRQPSHDCSQPPPRLYLLCHSPPYLHVTHDVTQFLDCLRTGRSGSSVSSLALNPHTQNSPWDIAGAQ